MVTPPDEEEQDLTHGGCNGYGNSYGAEILFHGRSGRNSAEDGPWIVMDVSVVQVLLHQYVLVGYKNTRIICTIKENHLLLHPHFANLVLQ